MQKRCDLGAAAGSLTPGVDGLAPIVRAMTAVLANQAGWAIWLRRRDYQSRLLLLLFLGIINYKRGRRESQERGLAP